jgi:hypothetical protein
MHQHLVDTLSSVPLDILQDEREERIAFNTLYPGNSCDELTEENFKRMYKNNCLAFVGNITLVQNRARTAYFMDCFYSKKLVNYIMEKLDMLIFIPSHLTFYIVILKEFTVKFMELSRIHENRGAFLGAVLGYPYLLRDDEDAKGYTIVSYDIEGVQLFGYCTPSDTVVDTTEILKSFQLILEPLGYSVSVRRS